MCLQNLLVNSRVVIKFSSQIKFNRKVEMFIHAFLRKFRWWPLKLCGIHGVYVHAFPRRLFGQLVVLVVIGWWGFVNGTTASLEL